MSGTLYLTTLKGLKISAYMFATWVLCFVPFALFVNMAAVLIGDPLADTAGKATATFIMVFFTVLADMCKSIVATAGVTYGLREIFTRQEKVRL